MWYGASMIDVIQTLDILDNHLHDNNQTREFIVCGGSAMILMNLSERPTLDVDMMAPEIDNVLKKASLYVADQLGLRDDWLNSSAQAFRDYLPSEWESRKVHVYSGKSLQVYSLCRADLLILKIFAEIERETDIQDIISISPSVDELNIALDFVEQNKHLITVDGVSYRFAVDSIKRELENG